MPQKDERSYFVYPKTKEERREAFTVFKFAREQKIQQPQYLDENGTIWRWDNKGNGRFGLIQTNKKLARNARDRARRLELSLTEQDFEEAFPGKGRDLYLAEKARIEEIYANANDTEDVDHIWSMNSGGLNVSQNLRPLPSVQNRAEGDRGIPEPAIQNALMLAETKADQVRLQGPRIPPKANLVFDTLLGGVRLLTNPIERAQQAYDLFTATQEPNSPLQQQVEQVARDVKPVIGGVEITGESNPELDVGKNLGEALEPVTTPTKAALKTGMTNVMNTSRLPGAITLF